jgi:hypothetical protein
MQLTDKMMYKVYLQIRRRMSKQRLFYTRTWGWWIVTFFAFLIVAYALAYLLLGEQMYPDLLAESFRARPWSLYSHAFFGLFALAIGPFQFYPGAFQQNRSLHRGLGKIYLIVALGTGLTGLHMAVYAYGGLPAQFGFGGMALAMLATTAIGYFRIRQRHISSHRAWMLRSYAAMFSAVTFRLWLPLLLLFFGGTFIYAYQGAAWLAWVVNLLWVEWYLRWGRAQIGVSSELAKLSDA